MSEKPPKITYKSKVVADKVSEIKTVTVTIPNCGGTFDPEEFKNATSQMGSPLTFDDIKAAIEGRRSDEVAESGGIGKDRDHKITPESFDCLMAGVIRGVEEALADLGLDNNNLDVSRLTTSCIRLGLLAKEVKLREKHYGAVQRVTDNDLALRNNTSGRTAHNERKIASAKEWQTIALQIIADYGEAEFWRKPRTMEAQIVLKELKKRHFDLKKGTVENFLRKIKE